MHVPVLLSVLVKIPSIRSQIIEQLHLQGKLQEKQPVINQAEECEDIMIILSNMLPNENKNHGHKPLFISLYIGDLVLHNCMFDLGASTNVMPIPMMKRLGLNILRPYRNICSMDSRDVMVCRLVVDVSVRLAVHPNIMIKIDIVVIDFPES